MKKIMVMISVVFVLGCSQLQSVANHISNSNTDIIGKELSSADISQGLKQALELGVSSGVDLLSQNEGYFRNELTRILLPKELQKVDETLRKIGLGTLADQGLKVLNRAAEQAVGQAKPIFIEAIKNLTFSDALSILSSDKNAATQYLKKQTQKQLILAFEPKIKSSLQQTGADEIWSKIIKQYNSIPFVTTIEPNLTTYVTEKAIDGLFLQIEQKEVQIRENISARTTPLLQKVFSKQ